MNYKHIMYVNQYVCCFIIIFYDKIAHFAKSQTNTQKL